MSRFLKDWGLTIFILTGITLGWQGLEKWLDGGIQPSNADSIIAVILATSIIFNVKFFRLIKEI